MNPYYTKSTTNTPYWLQTFKLSISVLISLVLFLLTCPTGNHPLKILYILHISQLITYQSWGKSACKDEFGIRKINQK